KIMGAWDFQVVNVHGFLKSDNTSDSVIVMNNRVIESLQVSIEKPMQNCFKLNERPITCFTTDRVITVHVPGTFRLVNIVYGLQYFPAIGFIVGGQTFGSELFGPLFPCLFTTPSS